MCKSILTLWFLAVGVFIIPISAVCADTDDWENGWAYFALISQAAENIDVEVTDDDRIECHNGLHGEGTPCWCEETDILDDWDDSASCQNPYGDDRDFLMDFASRQQITSPDFSNGLRGEPPPPKKDNCVNNAHADGCVKQNCGHYPCEKGNHGIAACGHYKCIGDHSKVDDCHYPANCPKAGQHAPSLLTNCENVEHSWKCKAPPSGRHYVCKDYAGNWGVTGCNKCFKQFHGFIVSHVRRHHGAP